MSLVTDSTHQSDRPSNIGIPGHRVLRAGILIIAGIASTLLLPACSGQRYDPALATRPYPVALDQDRVVDIQVFRDGADLIVVNASPQSFTDFDLWVNRRYMLHVESLAAGQSGRFNFGDFFDRWGESPIAGGFFRTERPTPIVLVQLQIGEDTPLLGATSVPEEGSY